MFGEIIDCVMILNDAGKMADIEWKKIPIRFTNVQLHEYIVMPNHFHAILEIVGATLVIAPHNKTLANEKEQPQGIAPANELNANENVQSKTFAPAKPKTVGDIVGAFQSIATVEYIRGVKQWGWKPFNGKLWQRNYYEHIIRDKQSYQRISNYIINNPKNWKGDKFYGQ